MNSKALYNESNLMPINLCTYNEWDLFYFIDLDYEETLAFKICMN